MAEGRNKVKKRREESEKNMSGMFDGMIVLFVPNGVHPRRLQIWKHQIQQKGGLIADRLGKEVTHLFAIDSHSLLQRFHAHRLSRFHGRILLYQWLEDSLTSGEKVSEDMYDLKFESADESNKRQHQEEEEEEDKPSSPLRLRDSKKIKPSADNAHSNNHITHIFTNLIDIYRALGDDRRSFSYYKAVSVIEQLPFRIESSEQVKHLPSIGKSMQDHIHEIVTTGKLSKLEHFQTDEKVRSISLFGQVWGIGPATALKLYEKGHRTLDHLKNETSLTNAQNLGLKYFYDIKQRIPRHQVQEMESLLKKYAEDVLPEVTVICGGSYRRGKPTCGDMDLVITHPDGNSHKGFLPKYVKHLKDNNFLKEDLVFSTHSEEGIDSGVDTYFGLCTYPGRELRHRIDLKVYPRDIFAFGLIAWTGNDVLNRRLRLLAESKGFRLDDTGLYPAIHGSPGKRGTKATASLKFKEEKEVFDYLGFPWLEPKERNL